MSAVARDIEAARGGVVRPRFPDGLDASYNSRTVAEENVAAVAALDVARAAGPGGAPAAVQAALMRYRGWGGAELGDVLRPRRQAPEWAKALHGRLVELVGEELLHSEGLDASLFSGFYTDLSLIDAMWAGARALGFRGGRVLEPGAGVGRFAGRVPDGLDPVRFTLIERDPIAGGIAEALFGATDDVRVSAIEDAELPDGFYDLVIGNVPFANVPVADPRYGATGLALHNYCIVRALDCLRPGGLAVLITSAFTLDGRRTAGRLAMAERARLIGALRLPVGAHAGTEAVSDVLVLRRHTQAPGARETGEDGVPRWVGEPPMQFEQGMYANALGPLNEWFVRHPECVLGEPSWRSNRLGYGPSGYGFLQLAPRWPEGADLGKALAEALGGLAEREREDSRRVAVAGATLAKAEEAPPSEARLVEHDALAVEPLAGTLLVDPQDADAFLVVEEVLAGGVRVSPHKVAKAHRARLRALLKLRDQAVALLSAQVAGCDDDEWAARVAELRSAYEPFVARYGAVNARANARLIAGDPHAPKLLAVEREEAPGQWVPGTAFTRRTVGAVAPVCVDSLGDALDVSIDETGGVDLELIARLTDLPDGRAVLEALEREGLAFEDPATGRVEPAGRYLGGDVRGKLATARAAARAEPGRWERHVEALSRVQPRDVPFDQIRARIGAPWVSIEDYRSFLADLLGASDGSVRVTRHEAEGRWVVSVDYVFGEGIARWGVPGLDGERLIEHAMNGTTPRVMKTLDDGHRVLDEGATAAAATLIDRLNDAFIEWVASDPERRERVTRRYNERYNRFVPYRYDGSRRRFPGMSDAVRLRPVQADAVARAVAERRCLFAHEVGVGKTFEIVATAMELRRLGLARKPMVVVPDHLIEQFVGDARLLYPGADIVAVSKGDLTPAGRQRFLARVALGDPDLVVITYSRFRRIGVPAQFEHRLLGAELARIEADLGEAEASYERGRSLKRLAAARERRRQAMKKLTERLEAGRDEGLTIADLGVDALFFDESHRLKNLNAELARSDINPITGSQIAWDAYLKIRFIHELRGAPEGVFFASGTPATNNLLELYNLQRYLQPDCLEDLGLESLNAWAGVFLRPKTFWEPDPSGDGYRLRTRYVLTNVPELMAALGQVMDVKTHEDAGLLLPEVRSENVVVEETPAQARHRAELARRCIRVRSGGVPSSEDNLLKIVGEGRMAALDPRLIDPALGAGAKIEACAERIAEEYRRHGGERGTQIVFCDLGVPGGSGRLCVYDALAEALTARGVPREEIAYIHDAANDRAREALFEQVREGRVRVLIGSTWKMGEGTNVQARAVAVHHLDAPWRPSDIRQRDGRVVRQGNGFDSVRRYIYTTGDSFDRFTWSVLNVKARQFERLLRGEASVREYDDAVDPTYAETLAVTTSDPRLKRRFEIEEALTRLDRESRAHEVMRAQAQREVARLRAEINATARVAATLGALPEGVPVEWSFPGGRGDTRAVEAYVRRCRRAGEKAIEGIGIAGAQVSVHAVDGRRRLAWVLRTAGGEIEAESAGAIASLVAERRAVIARAASDNEQRSVALEDAERRAGEPFGKTEVVCRLRRELEQIEREMAAAESGEEGLIEAHRRARARAEAPTARPATQAAVL